MLSNEKAKVFALALENIVPSKFLESRTFLGEFYNQLKQHLPNYSYLEFSEDLGFSYTNVVFLIIKGRRPLSVKAAKKIAHAVGLSHSESKYFFKLVEYENQKSSAEREILFQKLIALKMQSTTSELSKSQLQFFKEWYHPIIRELVGLPGFKNDPHWIASQLQPKIRPMQAAESLKLLVELNLIMFDESSNTYKQTQTALSTGNEVSSMSVTRYHQKTIELAKESITSISEHERDISCILVPLKAESYAKIKEEIQAFRKKLLQMCEEDPSNDTVYQVNFQIFPITKKVK